MHPVNYLTLHTSDLHVRGIDLTILANQELIPDDTIALIRPVGITTCLEFICILS